jgi:hypothetical protein
MRLVRPARVFVPPRLAPEESASFAFETTLPSTCHSLGEPRTWIDLPQQEIILEVPMYWHSGSDCEERAIRNLQTVDLGPLPIGHFLIFGRLSKGNLIELGELCVGCKQ